MELDRTDIKILNELQLHGRLSNVELAEMIALSPSPCLRRLKQLEDSGVIRKYVALLDPLLIGLGLQAFIRVSLEKRGHSHLQEFVTAIQDWSEVVNCYAMTGEMDYLLQVYFEDMTHFSKFVMGQLLQHPGIADIKSSFVLKEFKNTTNLPLSHLNP
ncbi:MAG: Lrp/AsnC family transcriptional regulator [Proteobacteria bacterium]|jgi:Lrp/AsnC family leucine-responsive transcriptional regulator|nr:Lrp/AsnC family transcriptional regulator [Pseudomonadota bacterium]